MKEYLKLIRIKHWFKNILIFMPIFFSKNLLNFNMFINLLLAFFIFSFTASIVYIINDIRDLEMDKKHSVKCKRPLASGAITKCNAIIIIVMLIILNISLMGFLYFKNRNIYILYIPIVYLILNIAYSLKLKEIPIIDVAILVSGFVFRVFYGGIVVDITISYWLYLMIMFGAFYLGFGKRRNEMLVGKKTRHVLSYYNKDFLDKNMYVSLSLAIMCYSLWCVDNVTISRIGNNFMIFTIPFLMLILQRYSLIIEGNSDGDPIEVIFSDKILLALILFYILLIFIIIYII